MSTGVQRWCAWTGVGFTVLFVLGFAIAGFIPPPSPTDSPEEVAAMYRADQDQIHIGLLICTFGTPLLATWIAAISIQMRRIEGNRSPLAFAQAVAGACLLLEFLFPLLVWQTAAFRADRNPEIVQAINDLGWLPFLGIACTAAMQGIVFGIAILRDKREKPLFPRWFGYFNIWVVLMFCPASFVVVTQTGPLAWDGLISWWLAALTYFVWMIGVTWALLQAIGNEEAEQASLETAEALERLELDLDAVA